MCGPWLLPATASSIASGVSFPSTCGIEMILWPVASIAPVSRIAYVARRRRDNRFVRTQHCSADESGWRACLRQRSGPARRRARIARRSDAALRGCIHRCHTRFAASYSTWSADPGSRGGNPRCSRRESYRSSSAQNLRARRVIHATATSVWSQAEMRSEPVFDVHRVSRRERPWRVLARDLQHVQTRTCCGFGQRGAS